MMDVITISPRRRLPFISKLATALMILALVVLAVLFGSIFFMLLIALVAVMIVIIFVLWLFGRGRFRIKRVKL